MIVADFRVVCDVCRGRLTLSAHDQHGAITEARRYGWSCDMRHDRCPQCAGRAIPAGPYDTPKSPHPVELEAAGRMLIQLGEMERHYALLPDPPAVGE